MGIKLYTQIEFLMNSIVHKINFGLSLNKNFPIIHDSLKDLNRPRTIYMKQAGLSISNYKCSQHEMYAEIE